MSQRIMPVLITIGGFLMVGAALIGDGASSLVAGISVGRGGGSGTGGKVENGARAQVWQQFMMAQNAADLEPATQRATEAGVVVTVIRGESST